MFRDMWNYEHNERKAEFENITRNRQALRLRKREVMLQEQERHRIMKAEKRKRRKAELEEVSKKKAAVKKIRTKWKLQKRIEEQSKASLAKLRNKYKYFHDRLVTAKEVKVKCEKYLNGEMEVNVQDPLGFLETDEVAEDF